jgi:hypothetical protein
MQTYHLRHYLMAELGTKSTENASASTFLVCIALALKLNMTKFPWKQQNFAHFDDTHREMQSIHFVTILQH